tara:strand:+ start:29 stop:625 length:597 start_codon:yes stop_codon:yes gene_type:complete
VDLNYKTVNIFPVPVHQFDVNGFSEIQDELIDYVYKMRKKDPVGHTISNRRGWQSSCFSLENEDDILQNFLTNCLSEFPPIEKSIKLFVSAWININPPEAFNLKHNHPTSDLSGVLWIKSQKDCGNIVFESPRSFATHQEIDSYTEDFKKNNNYFHSFSFNPVAGRILVFPSHLEHHVDFNQSQEDRISVSFNIRLSE